MDLEEMRKRLDKLDAELIRLLAKRFELAHKIGVYKQEKDLPIEDEQREAELLQNRIEQFKNAGVNDPEFVKVLFKHIMHKSKLVQKEV